jgi:WD40 repeat protein
MPTLPLTKSDRWEILASGSADGTIKNYSLYTDQLMRSLEVRAPQGQLLDLTSAAFGVYRQTLVSGHGAGLRIW